MKSLLHFIHSTFCTVPLNYSGECCALEVLKMHLFPFLLVLLTFSPLINSNDNLDDDPANPLKGLQRGRTRRLIWLDKRRRLIFPPDTSLSVTPMLGFPLFKQSSTWVSFENLQIQWTFFILFEGLGWTSEDNAWPIDISLLLPNMTSSSEGDEELGPEGGGGTRQRRKFYESCGLRIRNSRLSRPWSGRNCRAESIPIMALPTSSPGGERALIFPRIEKFLSSFGLDGRACLQRVVCEVQEVPLRDGFGLLGEFLTMFFSVSQSAYATSHLPGYLRAEKAGKLGDCSGFYEKCPFSIFTSKK